MDQCKEFRVLLIAYYYPPLGGPASIRLGKTVKYLKKEKIKVDVVTVKNIAYHSTDNNTFEESLPDRIEYASSYDLPTLLYHVKKLISFFTEKDTAQNRQVEGGNIYFFLPEKLRGFLRNILPIDEKLFWYFGAKKRALYLLRTRKHDFIITSIGPYTAALIGYSLSKVTGIPLLVDYRDHWTLNPYEYFRTPINKILSEKWERRIINQASCMTFIGEAMRDELRHKYPEEFPEKSAIVYNGFDESDFIDEPENDHTDKIGDGKNKKSDDKQILSSQNDSEFVFTYTGNFYHQRTPYYFCMAIQHLIESKQLPENVRIRFIGNYHKEAKSILNQPVFKNIIQTQSYQPHKKTIQSLLKSDCLLLFIPSADGKSVLTSKLFEYLRSGKPILAMIPELSEAADILTSSNALNISSLNITNNHYICPPENVQVIAQTILTILEHYKSQKVKIDGEIKQRWELYSREEQTKKLVKLMLEYERKD